MIRINFHSRQLKFRLAIQTSVLRSNLYYSSIFCCKLYTSNIALDALTPLEYVQARCVQTKLLHHYPFVCPPERHFFVDSNWYTEHTKYGFH